MRAAVAGRALEERVHHVAATRDVLLRARARAQVSGAAAVRAALVRCGHCLPTAQYRQPCLLLAVHAAGHTADRVWPAEHRAPMCCRVRGGTRV